MQVIQSVKHFFETYKKITIAVILFIIADIFFGIRFVNNILSIGTAKESGYYYIDMNGKMVNSEAYMEEGTPFSKDGVACAKGIPMPGKSYGGKAFINEKGKIIKGKYYNNIELEGSFSFPLLIKEYDVFKLIDKDMNVIAEQTCDGMKGIWRCYNEKLKHKEEVEKNHEIEKQLIEGGYVIDENTNFSELEKHFNSIRGDYKNLNDNIKENGVDVYDGWNGYKGAK